MLSNILMQCAKKSCIASLRADLAIFEFAPGSTVVIDKREHIGGNCFTRHHP